MIQKSGPLNRYDQCLYMDLDAEAPQHNGQNQDHAVATLELYLTINFDEEVVELKKSRTRLRLGFKSGKLELTLQGVEVPYEDRAFLKRLDEPVDVERGSSVNETTERNVGVGFTPKEIQGNIGVKKGTTTGVTVKTQNLEHQIRASGTPNKPNWIFEVKTGEPVLVGTIPRKWLATLNVRQCPCQVTAVFISDKGGKPDFKATVEDEPLPVKLSLIAQRIFQQKVRKELEKELSSTLSEVTLSYG